MIINMRPFSQMNGTWLIGSHPVRHKSTIHENSLVHLTSQKRNWVHRQFFHKSLGNMYTSYKEKNVCIILAAARCSSSSHKADTRPSVECLQATPRTALTLQAPDNLLHASVLLSHSYQSRCYTCKQFRTRVFELYLILPKSVYLYLKIIWTMSFQVNIW